MSYTNNHELKKQGFTCFAGPFAPHEREMIPAFLKDADNANKETRQSVEASGIYLWQKSKSRN
jgi:hypothetical protein